MKTVYIRRLDGEIIQFPEDTLWTRPIFYETGMCKVIAKDLTYIVHSSNIEIISDTDEELDGDGL